VRYRAESLTPLPKNEVNQTVPGVTYGNDNGDSRGSGLPPIIEQPPTRRSIRRIGNNGGIQKVSAGMNAGSVNPRRGASTSGPLAQSVEHRLFRSYHTPYGKVDIEGRRHVRYEASQATLDWVQTQRELARAGSELREDMSGNSG
jgi:hypothetical protein